jgi:hypothetical protein
MQQREGLFGNRIDGYAARRVISFDCGEAILLLRTGDSDVGVLRALGRRAACARG